MTRNVLLTVLATARLFAAEPYIGTWKLDVAKSTFEPGPPPSSQLLWLDNEGGMVKLQLTESNSAGTAVLSASFRIDGKPYQVQGSKLFDSVSATWIGDDGRTVYKMESPSPHLQLNWM